MTSITQTVLNKSPYLRSQRNFPNDSPQSLSVELDRAYVDIANMVNTRTIGVFTNNRSVVNGESWFLSGSQSRQQVLRQIFQFSDANLTITHGINLTGITYFTRIYGTFFDGTFWQSLPYVDVIAANNQINVKVSATQIIVTKGGGAPPSISNGLIVIEWMSNI